MSRSGSQGVPKEVYRRGGSSKGAVDSVSFGEERTKTSTSKLSVDRDYPWLYRTHKYLKYNPKPTPVGARGEVSSLTLFFILSCPSIFTVEVFGPISLNYGERFDLS